MEAKRWEENGVHNPGHADHEFRRMPITDSVSCRSPIAVMPISESGHAS
jgi:hypothetical protein